MSSINTEAGSAAGIERRSFKASLADLDFSILVPHGFEGHSIPFEATDFSKPTAVAALMMSASPVAAAVLMVSARPAFADGSVMEWFQWLAQEQGLTLTAMMPGQAGPHPAIVAQGWQVQDGTRLRFHLAALEDGGRFVLVVAMVPEALYPSFGSLLERSTGSIVLDRARGPTAPLVPGGAVPELTLSTGDGDGR